MMSQRLNIACDLSRAAFEQALALLKETRPDAVEVFHSSPDVLAAAELAREFGCTTRLVPDEIMNGLGAWAIRRGHDVVWSEGA